MNLLHVPFHQMYQKAKSKAENAKQNKKTCELIHLTVLEMLELIGNGRCAYTGTEFQSLEDATFERINPNKGYVKGNVVFVTSGANGHKASLDCFVKGDVIPDEMKIKLLRKAIYQLEKKVQS